MKIYSDPRLLSAGFIGGTVSRHTGNMCADENQTALYKQLGIAPQRMLHFHQTHSARLLCISSPDEARAHQAAPVQDADAWLIKTPGWGAAILTADCVPLFLWDAQSPLFALAHCGWRGVVQRLPYQAACALKQAGAKQIFAWAGPHIQRCCFEVQQDVACQFPPDCLRKKNGKLYIDMNVEIKRQLLAAGISAQDIKLPYYCTCGDRENFFSWRRDHIRQNLLSFIYRP